MFRKSHLRGPAAAFATAAALLAAPAALAPTAAAAKSVAIPADQPVTKDLKYKLYVGGVLIGKIDVRATLRADGYAMQANMKTDGVAGWFLEAAARVVGEGRRVAAKTKREKERLTPESFLVKSVYGGKPQDVDMRFTDGAPSSVVAEPPFKKKWYEIDPTQQGGSLDPVAAAAAALLPSIAGEPCNRVLPIFDGRRRYDIRVGKQVAVKEGENGVKIVECDASVKRVAGFKKKYLKKPPYPFKARFIIEPNGMTTPQRVWAETDFGAAVAVLR